MACLVFIPASLDNYDHLYFFLRPLFIAIRKKITSSFIVVFACLTYLSVYDL